MTYNFDPDRWFEDRHIALEMQYYAGEIGKSDYTQALAALERRYDEMLERLDGTYQLPRQNS